MKTISSLLAVAAALLLPVISASAQDNKTPTRVDPISEMVTELVKKGFNTFVAAIAKTDYINTLPTGTFTVLAPTDVAFRDLPKAQLDALLADKEKLTGILSHHIIEGKVSSADLKGGKVKTLAGTTVEAKVVDGKIKIGAATLVRQDLPATNGTIHGVDKFLQP